MVLSVPDSRADIGPYQIEEYRGQGKYVLSSIEDGKPINNGAEVKEEALTLIE